MKKLWTKQNQEAKQGRGSENSLLAVVENFFLFREKLFFFIKIIIIIIIIIFFYLTVHSAIGHANFRYVVKIPLFFLLF